MPKQSLCFASDPVVESWNYYKIVVFVFCAGMLGRRSPVFTQQETADVRYREKRLLVYLSTQDDVGPITVCATAHKTQG